MTQVLLVRIGWIVVSTVVVLGGVTGCVAWMYRPSRVARDMTRERRTPGVAERIAATAQELEGRGLEVIELEVPSAVARTEEGKVMLRGWFVRPKRGGTSEGKGGDGGRVHRCVVLYHGLGPSRLVLEDWLYLVLESGWNAALFDLRAHGISDGRYCTFGHLEARETADEIRYLRERFAQERIVSFGYSMGGAVALLSLDHLTPGTVERIVTVGTYASFPQVSDEYLQAKTWGMSTENWRRQVVEEGEHIFGSHAEDLSPERMAGRLDHSPPMLIVHGTEDTMVAYSHAERLAEAFGDRAQLFVVDGAGHFDILELGGERLRAAFRTFLNAADGEALPREEPAGS